MEMNNAPVCPSKWSLWGTFLADILPKTLNKSSLVFSLLFNCSLCIQIRSWIVYWSRKSVWEQEFMRARIAPNSYLSDKGREYKYVVIWKCRRYRFLGPASWQSRATEQQLLHQLYTPPPAAAPAHCTSSIPHLPTTCQLQWVSCICSVRRGLRPHQDGRQPDRFLCGGHLLPGKALDNGPSSSWGRSGWVDHGWCNNTCVLTLSRQSTAQGWKIAPHRSGTSTSTPTIWGQFRENFQTIFGQFCNFEAT